MSNRDFPAPQRPDGGWNGRPSSGPAGGGDYVPPRSRSASGGYAKASGTSGRGRGVGELDGYGRGTGNGGRGGQHAQGRSSRGGGERYSGQGPADAPANGAGNGYRSRRGAPGGPGQDGRRSSGRPGGDGRSSRDRGAAEFGNGRRDIRDDLRARLRRNGIGSEGGRGGGWGNGANGAPPRPGRTGTGWNNLDDTLSRLRGRLSRNGAEGFTQEEGPGRWFRRKGAGGGDWGDGPGGRPPRRKGSWWRHWSWKKVLGVVAALFGGLIILGAAGVAYAYSKTTIPPIQTAVFQQKSSVYFSDGKTLVGQYGTTNRVILNYNQIPKVLINAVVAAEDKNFWHEGGISPTGIIRAAYYDLTSSGGSLQGASTITQQLVRNYYENIGTAQTLSRKIKEIFVAEKLAQAKSKQWILQQYLNTIYLGDNGVSGDGAYGVASAADVYFGIPANKLSQITPAQAAMIAALIQSPGYYSPNPKDGQAYQALVWRWHYVINAMVGMGNLSSQEAAHLKFPAVSKPPNNNWSGYKGYIMQAVQYELENTYNYSPTTINNGGLKIVTTFNKKLMSSLYATVRSDEKLMHNCSVPAVLSAAAQTACTKLPRYVHVGAVLEQPNTGAILAMYSGPSYSKSQYDDALQSRNQVGSSFKPYVLATAVQQGMNVQTSTLDGDSPLCIPPDSSPATFAKVANNNTCPSGGYYQVTNDESGGNSLGPVTVKTATAASLNTAYTDLWHRVAVNPQTGAHNVVNMAAAFGVDVKLSGLKTMQDEAGTALGQASLTAEEQATTIATLADKGVYHSPHVIQSITNGSQVIPARITQREVLNPQQAADVDWAMSFDTQPGGTANGLGMNDGQTVIAKTGTTNLSQSAFFMGATPKYAMAVGMFVSKPTCPPRLQAQCSNAGSLAYAPPKGIQTLFGVGGLSGYGGQWPAYIWHDYFNANFDNGPLINFPLVNTTGMAKWNLMGNNPGPPKPHHHDQQQGGGPGGCHGQGGGGQGGCHHHNGGGPTPPPTPTATATPTPTSTATVPPGGISTRAAGSGGAAPGVLALAAVVVVGPSLSLIGRLRERRRRKAPHQERPPAS